MTSAQSRLVDATMTCRRCVPTGRCRFGIDNAHLDLNGDVTATITCPESSEGIAGIAHGGWTATVLDELCGLVATVNGSATMTKSLYVEYFRPVPLNTPLHGAARLQGRVGRRWSIEAELHSADRSTVLASASGVWVEPRQVVSA